MSRARGFAPWRPHAATFALVGQAQATLDEYQEHWPLTIRQIFYRLIARLGYEKTTKFEGQLYEAMNRARRCGMIQFNAIRDDGAIIRVPRFWTDPEELVESAFTAAATLRLDRQEGQPVRLFLWCEAAGMVPQLERVAEPFGITVLSGGGFDSVTAKYTAAQTITAHSRAEVLHIGDLDPSGEAMWKALAEDIEAFRQGLGNPCRFAFSRLAVTQEQVEAMSLPTAPPKATDRRSFDYAGTVQAEAIQPDMLAQIVREAIEARTDRAILDSVRADEARIHVWAKSVLRPALEAALVELDDG
jgi:hypothetical protein